MEQRAKRRFGKLKFYADRLQGYWGKFNSVLLLYLTIKISETDWYWWVLGIVVGSLVVIWFDIKYVVNGELNEFAEQNPAWQNLLNEIRKLNDKT